MQTLPRLRNCTRKVMVGSVESYGPETWYGVPPARIHCLSNCITCNLYFLSSKIHFPLKPKHINISGFQNWKRNIF